MSRIDKIIGRVESGQFVDVPRMERLLELELVQLGDDFAAEMIGLLEDCNGAADLREVQ